MVIVKFLKSRRAIPVIAAPFIIALTLAANLSEPPVSFFINLFPVSIIAMLPALAAKMPDTKKVNLDTILLALVAIAECFIIRSALS